MDNIKILGDGSISSGKYNEVKVYGSADVKGEVTCEVMKVKGEITIDKAIIINDLFEVMGELSAKDNITFKKMKVYGEISDKGECQGEECTIIGAISVEGLLSADDIDISVLGLSEITQIGGEKIKVRRGGKYNFGFVSFRSTDGKLVSELIEGDDIYLEYTECNRVSGRDIVIGPGCKINKIEYSGKLTTDKNSEVGEEVCIVV